MCACSPKVTAHMSCVRSSADVPRSRAPIKIILQEVKTCKRLYNYRIHLMAQHLANMSLNATHFIGQMLFTATLFGHLKGRRYSRGPTQVFVFVMQQHVQKLVY